MADDNQEEIMTEMVEVTLQLFACRTCEMRFNSLEEVKAHISDEHTADSVAKGINLKEEIDDEETTEAGYVIIEERQLIPQGLELGEDQLFQLANGGENGQYVLHVIENDDHDELIEQQQQQQQQQQQIAQAKSRSRKRKLVEKVIAPQTTRSKRSTVPNIKSEFIYDNGGDDAETSMYTLVQEGNVITAWHNSTTEGEISAAAAEEGTKNSPNTEDNADQNTSHHVIDPANHKFPDDYTPTHKVKKGRVNVPEIDDSALRKFPCPFQGCKYIAKYRSNLWDHKKTHTGEKPYVCTWPSCSMKFSQTHQLKLHLRSHTGERPYVCNWLGCNSSFSQKPGLKSHMLTHTGEKPFKCDFPGCGWTFRLKGALTDHKRAIHENAKKHICEWPGCNKRFLQQCHLKKHIMGHADIKPFSCDWPNCNYRAVTMAYVTNHRKTHTGEKNYECTYPNCNKRFVKSSHVNRHRARCHPDLYQMLADNTFEDEETEHHAESGGDIPEGGGGGEQGPSRTTRSKANKKGQQIVYKVASGQNGDEGEEATIYIQSEDVEEEMVVAGEAVGQFVNGDTVVSESGEHYIISTGGDDGEEGQIHAVMQRVDHEDEEEEEEQETPIVFKKEHLDEDVETEIEPRMVSEHHQEEEEEEVGEEGEQHHDDSNEQHPNDAETADTSNSATAAEAAAPMEIF